MPEGRQGPLSSILASGQYHCLLQPHIQAPFWSSGSSKDAQIVCLLGISESGTGQDFMGCLCPWPWLWPWLGLQGRGMSHLHSQPPCTPGPLATIRHRPQGAHLMQSLPLCFSVLLPSCLSPLQQRRLEGEKGRGWVLNHCCTPTPPP